MSTPRFDLVTIVRIIEKRKKFVMIITLLCMVVGTLFHFVRKKKYEAESAFFVANPLYLDRSSVFTPGESRNVDYFADEDDIDHVLAIAESDTIIRNTIINTGLDKEWNMDMNNPYWANEAKKKFKDHYEVKRTAYTLMEVYFSDHDPKMAAKVANEIVDNIEHEYRGFYLARRLDAANSIKHKMHDIDSTITYLTDTLTKLRNASGIMDLMSPARLNLVTSTIKGNGGKNMGMYVEVIQNFESIKDQLVADRAKSATLLNQYSTGNAPGETVLLHEITTAQPPVDPAGPKLWILIVACAFVGMFFSIVYLLLTSYYKAILSTEE